MDLNTPNRPVKFPLKTGRATPNTRPSQGGWNPFKTGLGAHEYDLIPYANTHPIRKLYPDKTDLAIVSRMKHPDKNPLLRAVALNDAAKAESASMMSQYILQCKLNPDARGEVEPEKQQALDAATDAVTAFVDLANECIKTIGKDPNNQPIQAPSLQDFKNTRSGLYARENCTISYKSFKVESGMQNVISMPTKPRLSAQNSGNFAWSTPCPWFLAKDLWKHRVGNPRYTASTVLLETIYNLIAETAPRIHQTSRVRELLRHALENDVLNALHDTDRQHALADQISEHPLVTSTPILIMEGTDRETEPDDNGHAHMYDLAHHTIMLSARSVNVCADWHNPAVNEVLKNTVTACAANTIGTHVSNLCNITIRIIARSLDIDWRARKSEGFMAPYLAGQWECHVLEIMPFAGPDACTTTTLYLPHPRASQGPPGFLDPGQYRESSTGIWTEHAVASALEAKTCVGAHRNVRFSDLQLVKLLAEACRRSWNPDGSKRLEEYDASDPKTYAARISCEYWDFILSTHALPDGEAHTIIVAVNYPPHITHTAHAGRIPNCILDDNSSSSRLFYIHLVAADQDDPDFYDDDENFVNYFANTGYDGEVDSVGIWTLHQDLLELKRAIAGKYTWDPRKGFFYNIMHNTISDDPSQPLAVHESMRMEWINHYRQLIKHSIEQAFKAARHENHAASQEFMYSDQLLSHGIFRLNSNKDKETKWKRILGGDEALYSWYMDYLRQHPPPQRDAHHDPHPHGSDPRHSPAAHGRMHPNHGQQDSPQEPTRPSDAVMHYVVEHGEVPDDWYPELETDSQGTGACSTQDGRGARLQMDPNEHVVKQMKNLHLAPETGVRDLCIVMRGRADTELTVYLRDNSIRRDKIKEVVHRAKALWNDANHVQRRRVRDRLGMHDEQDDEFMRREDEKLWAAREAQRQEREDLIEDMARHPNRYKHPNDMDKYSRDYADYSRLHSEAEDRRKRRREHTHASTVTRIAPDEERMNQVLWDEYWQGLIESDITRAASSKTQPSYWYLRTDTKEETREEYLHKWHALLSKDELPRSFNLSKYCKQLLDKNRARLFAGPNPAAQILTLTKTSPPPGLNAPTRAPASILQRKKSTDKPSTLAAHVSRLERKIQSTEQMGNMMHLIQALLTKLDHA